MLPLLAVIATVWLRSSTRALLSKLAANVAPPFKS